MEPIHLNETQIEDVVAQVRKGENPTLTVDGESVAINSSSIDAASTEAIRQRLQKTGEGGDGNPRTDGASLNDPGDNLLDDGIEEKPTTAGRAGLAHDAKTLLPGGVPNPEGYEHIGTFTANHEDGQEFFTLEHVNPKLQTLVIPGLSATVEGHVAGKDDQTVTLRCRVIHDGAARAYVFRKDEDDTTHLVVNYGHHATPVTP